MLYFNPVFFFPEPHEYTAGLQIQCSNSIMFPDDVRNSLAETLDILIISNISSEVDTP
jgi:hypothetical protein